jgi:hypothetical protein
MSAATASADSPNHLARCVSKAKVRALDLLNTSSVQMYSDTAAHCEKMNKK